MHSEIVSNIIDNERRACDAVVRVLEKQTNYTRTGERSPEDDGDEWPIEYVCNVGNITYALEHTVIEAFDGQIRKDVDFANFIAPMAESLDHHMPRPGSFRLTFDIDPSAGRRRPSIPACQAAIIDWVRNTAAELHLECPDVPTRSCRPHGHESFRRATVSGIRVQLHREVHWSLSDKFGGRLFCSRFAPCDYETLRISRMRTAFNKKLPKLHRWKNMGARSVLVLENRDLSLSNHVIILEAAEEALNAHDKVPDELWLLDTCIATEWTVWCLMRDSVSLPDEETEARYYEFDPKELVEVGSS